MYRDESSLRGRLAQLEAFRGAAAEWVLEELLAAIAAKIESLFAIRVSPQQSAIFIEFIEALEHFVKIFEVIAIFIDPGFFRRRSGVQLHLYNVARFVLRIDLTLAKIAYVTNHLATILS